MKLNENTMRSALDQMADFMKQLESHKVEHKVRPIQETYIRLSLLGEGSEGQVWKCKEKRTDDRYVAIKIVSRMRKESMCPLHMVRQIHAMRQLQKHPNIVDMLDVCSYDDIDGDLRDRRLCIVMEYCPYTLYDVIHEPDKTLWDGHMLTMSEKRYLAEELLQGLNFIHTSGLVHRDFKPDNVLIAPDGTPKIADFGWCRYGSEELEVNTPGAVTLHYRPPELLLNIKYSGMRVDLWSLGLIWLELVTNNLVFPQMCEIDLFKGQVELLGMFRAADWDRGYSAVIRLSEECYVEELLAEYGSCDGATYRLRDSLEAPWAQLILQCLNWNPEQRTNTQNLCIDPAWNQLPLPKIIVLHRNWNTE